MACICQIVAHTIMVRQGLRQKVNGQVLNEAWSCEDVAGWICLQSEGAEIHFRDIKLIELKEVE